MRRRKKILLLFLFMLNYVTQLNRFMSAKAMKLLMICLRDFALSTVHIKLM